MKGPSGSAAKQHIEYFERKSDWEVWLSDNHDSSPGVWLQLAKQGSNAASISYDEAVEIALCFGWIDGQKQAHSDQFWLQKFTPRSDRSIWSKINRDKALALIKAKKMKPAGLKEVERAKLDGPDGTLHTIHPVKRLCQAIFNPRWMPMREQKHSLRPLIVGIDTPSCSGYKPPKRPKRAPNEFRSSSSCWNGTRRCIHDQFRNRSQLSNFPIQVLQVFIAEAKCGGRVGTLPES